MKITIYGHESTAQLRLLAKLISDMADLPQPSYDISPSILLAEAAPAPVEEPRPKKSAKPAAAPSSQAAPASAPTASGSDTTTDKTLVEVRALLAAKSRDGKTEQVKSLIGAYGVSALTAVPVEKLGELYAKGEAL